MTSLQELKSRKKKAQAALRKAQRDLDQAQEQPKPSVKRAASVSGPPEFLQNNWNGQMHLSGRAYTETIRSNGSKFYLAVVDGQRLKGVYSKRRHARAACSQKLLRLGLKAGVDWLPVYYRRPIRQATA